MVRSYTTDSQSFTQTIRTGYRQLAALRRRVRAITSDVEGSLRHQAWFVAQAEAMTGLALTGIRALEIGHGQMPLAAAFLAAKGNEVHGIDLDVVPAGWWDAPGYIRLLRTNGVGRTLKTFGRELTGINSATRREFVRQLGLGRWPRLHLRQASATALPYPADSFDFVFSFHVLEHIDTPEQAVAEAVRVLRPGGAVFFVFPHHAHANALHDMRWITGSPGRPAAWAHLSEDTRHTVQQGAFVNTLRLDDWRDLFTRACPGALFDSTPLAEAGLAEHLEGLRAAGKLLDFSDAELLTDDLLVGWRKPQPGA